MSIPTIAFFLRIMYLSGGAYLGFPGPMSYFASYSMLIFSNLWWVLLLLIPIVWFRHTNPRKGFALSLIAFSALFFIPPVLIKAQTKALLAEAKTETYPIQDATKFQSVTIAREGCDDLCERLLAGNSIKIVRTSKTVKTSGRKLIYKRAPIQECQDLDKNFDDPRLCILAYPNDDKISDIIIEDSVEGTGYLKREMVGFSPKIYMKRTVILRDNKSKNILASDEQIRWVQPIGYVPLQSNTGFDGTGIHGGGLIPPQAKHITSAIDASVLFEKLGLNLASSLIRQEENKSKYRRGKIYRTPAPYDEALEKSIFKFNDSNKKRVYWHGYWKID